MLRCAAVPIEACAPRHRWRRRLTGVGPIARWRECRYSRRHVDFDLPPPIPPRRRAATRARSRS